MLNKYIGLSEVEKILRDEVKEILGYKEYFNNKENWDLNADVNWNEIERQEMEFDDRF